VAQRIRIVLLLDEGASYQEIKEQLGAFSSTIARWKQRYEKDGLLGLATIHPGQPPQKLTPQLRAKVLEKTRQAPPDDSTHWSLRKMAAVMKVSKNLIARIWKEADLKPHRLERYMASNDPQFEEKAAAIIGLYLNRPKMLRFFEWMKRVRFKRSTGVIAACPYRRAAPRSTGSNITGTARCRCTPR
jgi:transposase